MISSHFESRFQSELLKEASKAFRAWTDSRYVDRGRGYLSRVERVSVTPGGAVMANVRGTKTYTTRLYLNSAGKLEGECSCPVGGRCKHAVALAMHCARFAEKDIIEPLPASSAEENLSECILFWFVVLPGVKNVSMLREMVGLQAESATNGNRIVRETCDRLAKEGSLRHLEERLYGGYSYGNSKEKYELAKRFSVEELRQLFQKARDLGWWPDAARIRALCASTLINPLTVEQKSSYVNRADVLAEVFHGLVQLLFGEGAASFDVLRAESRAVLLGHWLRLIRREEDFLEGGGTAVDSPAFSVRLADYAFAAGRSIIKELEKVVSICRCHAAKLTIPDLSEVAALCVWTGRRDLIERLFDSDLNDSNALVFLAALRDEGKSIELQFGTAYQAGMRIFEDYPQAMDDCVAFRLFLATLAVRLGATNTTLGRLAAYRREFDYRADRHPLAQGVAYCLLGALSGLENDLDERLERRYGRVLPPYFFVNLGDRDYRKGQLPYYCSYFIAAARYAAQGIRFDRRDVPRLIKVASWGRTALEENYPTLAGVIVSAMSGLADEGLLRAMADEVDYRKGYWLLPQSVDVTESWRDTLKELASVIPQEKSRTVQKATREEACGSIVWGLEFKQKQQKECASGPIYALSRIAPALFKKSIKDAKEISLQEAAHGKSAACLSPEDRELVNEVAIRRSGANRSDGMRLLCERLTRGVALARIDHRHRNWASRANDYFTPITLCKGELPVKIDRDEQGNLSLSISPWCVDLKSGISFREERPDAYAYYDVSPELSALLAVFAHRGVGGVIRLPREAEAKVGELVEPLARVARIDGEVGRELVHKQTELRRIEEDVTPVVRLAFRNDELRATYGFVPYEGARFVEPIAESCEDIVRRGDETVMLVRDFRKEDAATDCIYEVLDGLVYETEGISTLVFRKLEEALKFLLGLQALQDKIRVEWLEGSRIGVSEMQQASFSDGKTERDWFAVQGEFKVDENRILDLVAMLQALDLGVGTFVRLSNGDFVRISESLKKRLEALKSAGQVRRKSVEVSRAAVPMLRKAFEGEDGLPNELKAAALRFAAEFDRKIGVPKTLQAKLRPYQQKGFAWLARHAACGFGACLADDMGLGKTVQTIALLLTHAKEGPSLVIAPASVCGNWRTEIARFAPSLDVHMAWEFDADEPEPFAGLKPGDIVVTSYGMLVSRARMFSSREWNGVVLDEAQAIKNDLSKRARVVKALKAKFRVAATGTPVENRLSELWSLFDFLNPGLLGPSSTFAERLTTREGLAKDELKRLVEPFILRRLKSAVLTDLPEKTEVTLSVELGPNERTAYEACRIKALEALEGNEDDRISILAELTRLRRFCSHPSLVLPEFTESAKLEALKDLLSDLKGAGHRALIFSQFTDYLAIVRRLLEEQRWSCQYLDGTTPIAERAKAVDSFQAGEGDFFLISLKAGGTGLNLTAANYVVLLDPWWNPAVENQAADRVHRIGQKNPVTVYRLIAAKTVEERVLELHAEKKRIAEDVLEGTGRTTLSPEVLMRLFAP